MCSVATTYMSDLKRSLPITISISVDPKTFKLVPLNLIVLYCLKILCYIINHLFRNPLMHNTDYHLLK